jgi:hypothetical protein
MMGYYVDVAKGTAVVLLALFCVVRSRRGSQEQGAPKDGLNVPSLPKQELSEGQLVDEIPQWPTPSLSMADEEACANSLVVGREGRFFRCTEALLGGKSATYVTEVDAEGIPCGPRVRFAGPVSKHVGDLI